MAFKLNLPPAPRHLNGWYDYDAKGRVLRLKEGLVVVPFKMHRGYWDAVVVVGNETYPRGGYNICVNDEDIVAAEELSERVTEGTKAAPTAAELVAHRCAGYVDLRNGTEQITCRCGESYVCSDGDLASARVQHILATREAA